MSRTILVVAAHSDDEAIGCGGTIARHVSEGDRVVTLFMTDGVSSRSGADNEDREIRYSAFLKAQKLLGVYKHISLEFPDNELDTIPRLQIVKEIENVISEMKPDIVYTHWEDDLNVDHQIVYKSLMTACRPYPGQTVREIHCFEVLSSTDWTYGRTSFTPNRYTEITEYIDIKAKALHAYHMEMRDAPHSRNIENIIRLAQYRGNCIGMPFAESFVTVRQIV